MPVFGLLKRGGQVHAVMIPNLRSTTLMPIIRQRVQPAEAMAEAIRRIGAALTGRADEVDRALPQLITSYLRVINRVGQSTDRLRIADEARVVEEELRAQGVPQLPELARLAARHMVLAAGGNAPNPEHAVRDIVEAAAPAQAPPTPRQR